MSSRQPSTSQIRYWWSFPSLNRDWTFPVYHKPLTKLIPLPPTFLWLQNSTTPHQNIEKNIKYWIDKAVFFRKIHLNNAEYCFLILARKSFINMIDCRNMLLYSKLIRTRYLIQILEDEYTQILDDIYWFLSIDNKSLFL